jgi:catechol 2,3-dioxygenase-like lactoylglutathione lyase family enzyme
MADESRYDEPVVNHVGCCTANLEQTTTFYVEVLGFEVERELQVPDEGSGPLLGVEAPVGLTARYLTRDSFVLELMAFDRPGNPPHAERVMNEPGLTHLSISVPDLAAALERVPAFGGEVVTAWPVAAIIRDPDGQLLELLPMDYRRRLDTAGHT